MSTKDTTDNEISAPQTTGSLVFDPEKYLGHIEELEMTEAKKTEFLRALWDIMATFVRLGWGVESVLPSVFQKASENDINTAQEDIPTHEFNVAAGEAAEGKEEPQE